MPGHGVHFTCSGLTKSQLEQFEFPSWIHMVIRPSQSYEYIDDCHFIGFGFWTQNEEDLIPVGSILMDNWRIVDVGE